MRVLNKVEKLIFEVDAWKLVLIIALLGFVKTGIWYIPNLGASQVIATNPFSNPFSDPDAHYLFWSWLGPFAAWLIGANGKWQFLVFHLFFSIAFTLLFIKIAFDNFPSDLARSSLVLFSALPVSATSYFWISADSITLFLMLLALASSGSVILTFIIGTLLGMQHFEQGFFAALGLLFAIALSSKQGYVLRYSWKYCLGLLIGVCFGKAALLCIFEYNSIVINSGRMHWLRSHIHLLLNQFFYHFHYIIWSVLGIGWFFALRFADWGTRSVPFFLSLACLSLLLPISGDQTRVLAIVTFPLISAYLLFNRDFLEGLTRREVALVFTGWALMPWYWVWGGIPKWSVFPYDVSYVLHELFGWFNIPADPALWPF